MKIEDFDNLGEVLEAWAIENGLEYRMTEDYDKSRRLLMEPAFIDDEGRVYTVKDLLGYGCFDIED